jgi:hypothetical protein
MPDRLKPLIIPALQGIDEMPGITRECLAGRRKGGGIIDKRGVLPALNGRDDVELRTDHKRFSTLR